MAAASTMLSGRRPFTDAAGVTLTALALCAATFGLSSSSPVARAASVGQLKQRINAGQGNVSSLQGTVRAASGRVAQLDASIAVLSRRLNRIQADIAAKSAELDKLRVQLAAARTRLSRLESFEAHAEQVLAQQLVASLRERQAGHRERRDHRHGFPGPARTASRSCSGCASRTSVWSARSGRPAALSPRRPRASASSRCASRR